MEDSPLFWNMSKGRVFKKEGDSETDSTPQSPYLEVNGSCHCKKVSFSARIPPSPLKAISCNCSICVKKGYLHLVLPKERVNITQESYANITTYKFNTGVANHTFCSTCGVQAFYTPRSKPDCISINVRCLNLGNIDVPIEKLDGRSFT